MIGSRAVAKAAPDGTTLLLATNTGQAVAPHLIKLSYDPMKDLTPVGLIVTVPNVLVSAGKEVVLELSLEEAVVKMDEVVISAAVNKPICVGVACSSTAAVSGSASIMTWLPNELVRIELHRRR